MPRTPDPLTRRFVLFTLAGAGIAGFVPQAAFAQESGDEEEDSGGGEDEEDGEDGGGGRDGGGEDNSGPGGGEDGGGEDGDGEDGGRDDDGRDVEDSSGGGAVPSLRHGNDRVRNVTVRYSDGWTELILDGQYKLIDNLNRQVIQRQATIEDFNRMVALGS